MRDPEACPQCAGWGSSPVSVSCSNVVFASAGRCCTNSATTPSSPPARPTFCFDTMSRKSANVQLAPARTIVLPSPSSSPPCFILCNNCDTVSRGPAMIVLPSNALLASRLLSGSNQGESLPGLYLLGVVAPSRGVLLDLIVVSPTCSEASGCKDASRQQRPVCPAMCLPPLLF